MEQCADNDYHISHFSAQKSILDDKWHLFYYINDKCVIMIRTHHKKFSKSLLYIDTIIIPKYILNSEAEQLLLENESADNLKSVSDKLKWYRCKNGLLQKELADYAGIDRTTYSRYEENKIDCYPIPIIEKIAELIDVPVSSLLDEYNMFIYNGQGKQVFKKRNSMNLTQKEFGKIYNVSKTNVNRWKLDVSRMHKNTWSKMFK